MTETQKAKVQKAIDLLQSMRGHFSIVIGSRKDRALVVELLQSLVVEKKYKPRTKKDEVLKDTKTKPLDLKEKNDNTL